MTARGEIAIVGSQNGTARFRDGSLLAPVVFTLTARAADAAETSLHVDFTVKGETVHQMELALKVVGTPAKLRRAANGITPARAATLTLLQDARVVGLPPRQRINLSLLLVGSRFCIELSDLRDGELEHQELFVAKDMDRTRLARYYSRPYTRNSARPTRR